MTPEKEIEIMKWLVDNYPNHETNCVKIWELIKIVNHYHESKVKKLNIPAVSGSLPCHHNFIQKDTYWKSCTHCGMIAPLWQ